MAIFRIRWPKTGFTAGEKGTWCEIYLWILPVLSSYVGRAYKERGYTIWKKSVEKNYKFIGLVSCLVKKAPESLNADLAFYYLIGKNVFQLLYKCTLQNFFKKHHCQIEVATEDKILWTALCSKLTMLE